MSGCGLDFNTSPVPYLKGFAMSCRSGVAIITALFLDFGCKGTKFKITLQYLKVGKQPHPHF